ncbi:cupin domain-containing protein [Sulfuriferula thiophila]|uniref:cupin domain-containing protein n=1 Tax=Sulfuriferula thiophila TaxID=1781211 RepID=UPI00278BC986|nr:cupin domain-containing protein [Sulfuriferula thiophila]
MPMNKQLLGGISRDEFLRDYWQKQPLLVRNAIPEFTGLIDPAALFELAGNEDVEARLVRQKTKGWDLQHGPFDESDFKAKRGGAVWTLLVQELNHYLPSGEALLQQFDFIPHARLDDLMVSYAVPGGGVGPHFDSYDVFLLQGHGHRRWQISAQDDLTLIDGAPLRILQNFEAEQEWVLGPGDMLYLPPRYAHDGVALDECMTYSIGFRAPTTQEIATQFLVYMQDKIELEGRYQDPDLALQVHPAEIGAAMVDQMAAMIAQVQWGRADVADFLGRYLTEPKPHVYFQPPQRALGFEKFAAQANKKGVRLAPQSRMLFHADQYYLNGEPVTLAGCRDALQALADTRQINTSMADDVLMEWLYDAYVDGYLIIGG